MASFEREKALVQLLLDRLGLDGSLSHPGLPETGIDVLVHAADDRVIGVQVTEADPHPETGKARAHEKRLAGTDTGKVYAGWAQNDPEVVLDSLFRSISRKVAIAERHSFASVNEVWLLICACIPAATISTFVVTPWLSADDMDQETHSVLQQSKYDRCFFLAILGVEQAFYRWERNCGWKKSVKLEDLSEGQRDDEYVISLLGAAGDEQKMERLADEKAKEVLQEGRRRSSSN